MDFFSNSGTLHHAYLVIGEFDAVSAELAKFFEKELDFTIAGNPDFWRGKYATFGVDDAIALAALSVGLPVAGERKIFIVGADAMTPQAQNALLKSLEEPKGGTHVFIIMPSDANVLPTLRSRLFIVRHGGAAGTPIDAKTFLAASFAERLATVKELVENISDEKAAKADAVKFINSLEAELAKKDFKKLSSAERQLLERVEKARGYASDPSASVKMLLEYLAIIA
ncbi:MAG: hypothetical protein KGH93_02395 [Patescibacteria group bacterium]|nr:hypothetical protein [Patescibacteria group bacterium]MDE1946027.1 hypothetical protein [Patescibacteria group bacterium]